MGRSAVGLLARSCPRLRGVHVHVHGHLRSSFLSFYLLLFCCLSSSSFLMACSSSSFAPPLLFPLTLVMVYAYAPPTKATSPRPNAQLGKPVRVLLMGPARPSLPFPRYVVRPHKHRPAAPRRAASLSQCFLSFSLSLFLSFSFFSFLFSLRPRERGGG